MSEWETLVGALVGAPLLPGARCRGRHHLFDEAGPGEADEVVAARHAQALALCGGCPALQPCRAWFDRLKPRERPGGVIAGKLHKWQTSTRRSA